jgi:CTP synthase
MRLGAWKCDIKPDSLAYKAYGNLLFLNVTVRYEYNSEFVDMHTKCRFKASG